MSTVKQTVQLFWRHARRYPKYLWMLAVFIPLSIITQQFLPPLILSQVLERLGSGDFIKGDVWGSFGLVLVLYAAMSFIAGVIFWRLAVIAIWKLEMNVGRDMSNRAFTHLTNQSAHFHANRFGGSLVSQEGKLRGAYVRFADTTVFEVSTLILAYLLTAIILLPRAPLIVAIITVVSAVYMIVTYFITRKLRDINAHEATTHNKQTGYLADAITNVMAVKSFAAEDYERQRFAQATEDSRAATMDLMRATTKRDIFASTTTSLLDIAAITIATASVVLLDADVATVFLVLAYTGNITRRLWEFSAHVLRNYNRSFGDAKDMVEILATTPEVQDPATPEQSRITKGEIIFNDVSFTHADGGDALFTKLRLTAKPGEKIGLVGHSGSGKTTLTKLLLRFSDINDGAILIDGQNIANITQADLRRSIAYVPQEPLLFHRSIRENIAYGKPDATEKEITQAAHLAHAAEFIDKLPAGYDTLVGERGVKLSGGQRQRIAIARAMLKDAPILVLDEATSALDSESERLIQDALWKLMDGRTAIVIAHRLSTIQRMDRIIVLHNGKIVEQGSHHQLLERGGTYAELWRHQSGGFIEE